MVLKQKEHKWKNVAYYNLPYLMMELESMALHEELPS